jgi:hypothetical protein
MKRKNKPIQNIWKNKHHDKHNKYMREYRKLKKEESKNNVEKIILARINNLQLNKIKLIMPAILFQIVLKI